MIQLRSELSKSTDIEMAQDFRNGDDFEIPGGGYTTAYMLKPNRFYYLVSRVASVKVYLSSLEHLAVVGALNQAGLGDATGAEIVQFDRDSGTRYFSKVVELRRLYGDGEKLTPNELLPLIPDPKEAETVESA